MRRLALILAVFFFSASQMPSLLVAEENPPRDQAPAQRPAGNDDAPWRVGGISWLKLGFEYRGRVETNTGIGYIPGNDDTYYLNRLRLNIAVEATRWLRFFGQGQDSRAPGYSRIPVPGNAANPLDLHQGYVEFGNATGGFWGLRVGRQEIFFGDGRLIGNSNWGNVGRPFDAARLTYRRAGTQLDLFSSSVVVPVNGGFDRPHFNNKFHGLYASIGKPFRFIDILDFYSLLKTNSRAVSELGVIGNLRVYTFGTRANGTLPHDLDYRLEIMFQAGHISRDHLRAWAAQGQLGYRPPSSGGTVRLAAEYNFASGDPNPRDGRRGTFDQLYPTSHDKLGTLDRIGYRNINDLAAKMEWQVVPKLAFNLEYHDFRLATRQDALYAKDGTATVLNRHATSDRVGGEIDLYATHQYSKHIALGVGYAHMFPGSYLKQTTGIGGASYPYLMWRYKL
jgi:hypothetical protein